MSSLTPEIKKIIDFLGVKATFDTGASTFIFGVDKNNGMHPIAEIRGWGAIQQLFRDQQQAAEFQDKVGTFIAEAITEKIQSYSKEEGGAVMDFQFTLEQICKEYDKGNSLEGLIMEAKDVLKKNRLNTVK